LTGDFGVAGLAGIAGIAGLWLLVFRIEGGVKLVDLKTTCFFTYGFGGAANTSSACSTDFCSKNYSEL